MNNFSIKIQGIESPLVPTGINGLKLLAERKKDEVFFRQKITGSLEFKGKEYIEVLPLEQECCKEVSVTISQNCTGAEQVLYAGKAKTNQFEWDFETCSARLQEFKQSDNYMGLYKYWERKINVCAIERTQTVRYTNRVEVSETVSNYVEVNNSRGILFVNWLYFIVQKTFEGTEYAGLIPASKDSMSSFLRREINPCTGKRNSLHFAVIYQASDFIHSAGVQATGLLLNGLINEDISVNLKDVLEALRNTFDLNLYIDNGKFRIEHLSFFENNLSYEPNNQVFSLDLSNEKYEKYLKDYKYNYKNATEDYYGIEELRLTLNEGMLKSRNASINPIATNEGTEIFQTGYTFGRFTDFEYGNIKFEGGCIPSDDKGEVTKKIRASSLFMTAVEPLRLADDSVDKSKWVLLDCKNIAGSENIKEIIEANCERIVRRVKNGNFSATAIMRDFLRYSKPFSTGLMSYAEKANGLIGKGYNRRMYSLIKTKKLKRISVPLCCDETFNPNLLVKLPNGTKAYCEKAEFQLSDAMINLDLSQVSSCGASVNFPTPQNESDCPPRGYILSVEQIEVQVNWNNICDNNGCYPEPVYANATRTTYTDGECGSYIEDIEN